MHIDKRYIKTCEKENIQENILRSLHLYLWYMLVHSNVQHWPHAQAVCGHHVSGVWSDLRHKSYILHAVWTHKTLPEARTGGCLCSLAFCKLFRINLKKFNHLLSTMVSYIFLCGNALFSFHQDTNYFWQNVFLRILVESILWPRHSNSG